MNHRIPVLKLKLASAGSIALPVTHVDNARQLHALAFYKLIGQCDREQCAVMMFSGSGAAIGLSVVGVGGINAVSIAPGMIFRIALLTNASAIMIAHNHPSGSSIEPSLADIKATARLIRVGWLVGINVVDHLIVGPNRERFTSLAERGLMNASATETRETADNEEARTAP